MHINKKIPLLLLFTIWTASNYTLLAVQGHMQPVDQELDMPGLGSWLFFPSQKWLCKQLGIKHYVITVTFPNTKDTSLFLILSQKSHMESMS